MHAISGSECSSDDDVSILRRPRREVSANSPSAAVSAVGDQPPDKGAPASRSHVGRPANERDGAAVPDSNSPKPAVVKPVCQYGSACYRKNPEHIDRYAHPDREKRSVLDLDDVALVGMPTSKRVCTGSVEDKQMAIDEMCNRFDFYLTTVRNPDALSWINAGSLSLNDILSLPVGELLESVQFNYMFDLEWLVEQYPIKWRKLPLLLVHGKQREAKTEFERQVRSYPHVKLCQARLDMIYGTHHSKMMLLRYNVGLRIVVTTANLIQQDWDQKTQGIWLSPLLPLGDGDSVTNFKKDMLEYLSAYKTPQLQPWIELVKQHDTSAVRVFLVASVPGRHSGKEKHLFGHLKLRKILQTHACCGSSNSSGSSTMASSCSLQPSTSSATCVDSWPVIAQFSSIGSLGGSPDQWLCKEWLTSLATNKPSAGKPLAPQRLPELQLIYPSVDNVRSSLEGYPAGGSLPYASDTARKQPYLARYMHQWRAENRCRTSASPHIKTYMRVAPDHTRMSWFLLTSANLSKAAWGALEKQDSQLMIRSYELGVLFLPSVFVSCEAFDIGIGGANSFPLPYDLPLTPYSKNDMPWVVDLAYTSKPDRHGCVWQPR